MAVRSRDPNVPPARFVAIAPTGDDLVAIDDDGLVWRCVSGTDTWERLPLHPNVMEVPDVG